VQLAALTTTQLAALGLPAPLVATTGTATQPSNSIPAVPTVDASGALAAANSNGIFRAGSTQTSTTELASISLATENINVDGILLTMPTAAGSSSTASIAAKLAASGAADSDEFSYDDE
jgi:hypothetical protein